MHTYIRLYVCMNVCVRICRIALVTVLFTFSAMFTNYIKLCVFFYEGDMVLFGLLADIS